MKLHFDPYVIEPFTDFYKFPQKDNSSEIYSALKEEMEEFTRENAQLHMNFQSSRAGLARYHQQKVAKLRMKIVETS
jgi:hypothetical protein